MTFYDITPVAKPRMTQRDKWKQRPCVMVYRAFKDECRLKKVKVGEVCKVIFHMPFPSSYTSKQKALLNRTPHQLKPDLDNLIKGLLDAVLEDDSQVYGILAQKFWAIKPGMEIYND